MLLSMFTSFLLARRFKGKVYFLLMTVVLILMSVLSIGFPSVWGTMRDGTTVWQVNLPAIPLSFPFHTSISMGPLLLLELGDLHLHACLSTDIFGKTLSSDIPSLDK